MANFKSGRAGFGNHVMARALAISLALHAVLLWRMPATVSDKLPQREASSAANILGASLRGAFEPRAVVPVVPPMPAAVPGAIHRQKPLPSAAPMAEPPSRAVPGMSGNLAPVAASTAPAAMPSSGDAGLDANGLREYRLGLAATARRFKRYPSLALERGWSGTAEVRIAIAADGAPLAAQLLSSSGHDLLDAAALDMLGGAARQTAVPAALRGRPFSVSLPVAFDFNSQ